MNSFLKKIRYKRKDKVSVEIDAVPEKPRSFSNIAATDRPASVNGSVNRSVPIQNATNVPNQLGENIETYLPAHVISAPRLIETPKSAINICVNNSHGFTIGESLTVNLSHGAAASFSSEDTSFSKLARSMTPLIPEEDKKEILFDSFDVIKESELWVIGDYLDSWKPFCLAIGVSSAEIEEAEDSSTPPKQSAIHLLRRYLSKFPDTTVGFVAYKLRETDNIVAFNQLLKLKS